MTRHATDGRQGVIPRLRANPRSDCALLTLWFRLKTSDDRSHDVAEARQGLRFDLVHDAVANAGEVDRVGVTQAIEASFRNLDIDPSSVLRIAALDDEASSCEVSDDARDVASRQVGEVGEFGDPKLACLGLREVYEHRVLTQGDVGTSPKVLVQKPGCDGKKSSDVSPHSFLSACERFVGLRHNSSIIVACAAI
jgi:hypothetical protein